VPVEIGQVEAIFRYPVKSRGGERLDVAQLGWHGVEGDKRLAFRRIEDRSGFPWLTAGKLPHQVLFVPQRLEDGAQGDCPAHVRTPDGQLLPVFAEELATEVGRRYGAPVQTMEMKHGIFDDATISVIASETVSEIGRLAGLSPDVRRFRPNVVVRLRRPAPFPRGRVGSPSTPRTRLLLLGNAPTRFPHRPPPSTDSGKARRTTRACARERNQAILMPPTAWPLFKRSSVAAFERSVTPPSAYYPLQRLLDGVAPGTVSRYWIHSCTRRN
jgi:hypothetical protein